MQMYLSVHSAATISTEALKHFKVAWWAVKQKLLCSKSAPALISKQLMERYNELPRRQKDADEIIIIRQSSGVIQVDLSVGPVQQWLTAITQTPAH